jgi:hypothetical protein
MNGFDSARQVERRAVERLLPFLKERAYDGRFVLTNKGPLARHLQTTVGDVLLNSDPDQIWGIEIKAEEEERWGNFFLELFSNRKWGTPGWMVTLQSDLLFYYFLDTDRLYVMNLPRLQCWAFSDGQLWRHPQKRQNKYAQLNDTWGACVPIKRIQREVGFKVLHPTQLQLPLDNDPVPRVPYPPPPPRLWENTRELAGLRVLRSILGHAP